MFEVDSGRGKKDRAGRVHTSGKNTGSHRDSSAKSPPPKKKKRKITPVSSSSEDEQPPIVREKKKKKKKVKKISSDSSSSSSEDSSGSSSDSGDVDHWSMLQEVWAVDNRPAMFRRKKVVRKMAWRELMEFRKEYLEECKASGKGGAMFGADPSLPVTKFKAGKDNRGSRIHPASLLRLPVVEPEEFWKKIPLRREPVFRSVPLQHCGGNIAVNELAIVRMHDR